MYELILSRFYSTPLALELNSYLSLERILLARAQGQRISAEEAEAWKAAQPYGAKAQPAGGQAIIGLYGPIVGRPSGMEAMSGMTSVHDFARLVRAAADDRSVESIYLDIDSPGGEASAVDDPIDAIQYAKRLKPVIAVTQGMMASAAYWIGSAASKVYATPNAMVGSIGVIYTHVDWSKANEDEGLKVTHLVVGNKKAFGNPDEPLSPEARAELMRVATDYYDAFVGAVAEHRNRSAAHVKAEWADGRVETGRVAKQLGMIDDLMTLEQALGAKPQAKGVVRSPRVATTIGAR